MSELNIPILYQDKNLLVVNKPAGLLVHSDKQTQEPTLADWLKKNYPQVKSVGDDPENRPGIVHRLDKETSGVLLAALNQKTFEYLKNQFQEKKIKKTYLALVWGKIKSESGVIEKPIGLKSGTTKRTVWTKNAKMVKPAVTKYAVKKIFDGFTLLEVEPLTGRTHQIRVHLASIGHPVVGDKIYGGKSKLEIGNCPPRLGSSRLGELDRQFLHADSIEFTSPDGQRLKISADLPPELASFLAQL